MYLKRPIHVAISCDICCYDTNLKVNVHVSMIMFQYRWVAKHVLVSCHIETVTDTCFSVYGSVAIPKDYFIIIITFFFTFLFHFI